MAARDEPVMALRNRSRFRSSSRPYIMRLSFAFHLRGGPKRRCRARRCVSHAEVSAGGRSFAPDGSNVRHPVLRLIRLVGAPVGALSSRRVSPKNRGPRCLAGKHDTGCSATAASTRDLSLQRCINQLPVQALVTTTLTTMRRSPSCGRCSASQATYQNTRTFKPHLMYGRRAPPHIHFHRRT